MAKTIRLARGALGSLFASLVLSNACSGTRPCEETLTCQAAGSSSGAAAGTAAGSSGKGGSNGGTTQQGGKGGATSGGRSGTTGKGGTGEIGGESGDTGMDGGAAGERSQGGRGGTSGRGGTDNGGAGGKAGAGPTCGNGRLDGNEECDKGPSGNGPGRACTADCLNNVCGDGDQGPDEGCDDGEDNGLGLLRCAPDCSRIIQQKYIVISDPPFDEENFQPNPVAKVDSVCRSGYKALFAYGSDRRATTIPFKSENAIDWVLEPYTYYYNVLENPIWLTRDVPLLGVEDGAFVGLENPISETSYVFVSNLNIDGTTLGTDNCQGWSQINTGYSKRVGMGLDTDEGYLFSSTLMCGYQVLVYCVEQ